MTDIGKVRPIQEEEKMIQSSRNYVLFAAVVFLGGTDAIPVVAGPMVEAGRTILSTRTAGLCG